MFLTLTCPSYGSVSDDGGPAVTPPVDTHEHLARFEVGPVHAEGWVGRCTPWVPGAPSGLACAADSPVRDARLSGSRPERSVNRWPAGHAATFLRCAACG